MIRLAAAVIAAIGSAGCGQELDDRPRTLEYVTTVILAPSCGNAQCHSSFARAERLAFDTVETARASITNSLGLVVPFEADDSLLYQVLVSPGGDGQVPRMPYDRPIPDADIALIHDWITDGAFGL